MARLDPAGARRCLRVRKGNDRGSDFVAQKQIVLPSFITTLLKIAADTADGAAQKIMIAEATLRRHLRFFGKTLIERAKIDHNSLVVPAADLVYAVTCGHFKVDPFPVDPDYLGGRAYLAADWRGGQVSYIHCSADRAFTRIQERSDGIERSVFHDQNHYGRRKHLRQHGVLESVGEMFGLHPQRRRSSGS
jgi:hypothetical protein